MTIQQYAVASDELLNQMSRSCFWSFLVATIKNECFKPAEQKMNSKGIFQWRTDGPD